MVPDRVPIVQAAWWWIGLEFIGEVGSASAVFERFDPVGEAIEVGRCDLLASGWAMSFAISRSFSVG